MSNVSVTVHLGPLELAKHSSQKFGQIERESSVAANVCKFRWGQKTEATHTSGPVVGTSK